jgi:glycosyltransferase involved in cell wall biosynthesis
MREDTLVSAVIPTRNRPLLVLRAVKTVLEQTYPNIEVVVVIDGPDEETVKVLEALEDARIRIIALTENVGGSEARNTGVREAKGVWIAFLDDDDEWLPEKLSRQLAAAETVEEDKVILSCKYIERSTKGSRIFPARLPDANERMDDYLCCPRGFRSGGEVLQTSTLVVPKALAIAVPFVSGLKRGQDFMWLVLAGSEGQASFRVVPEVLSIFNAEGFTDTLRISTKPNWRSFYACVRDSRRSFSRVAYAYCIATRILTDVIICEESFFVKIRLLGDCLISGWASPRVFLVFLYVWLVPQKTRSRLGESLRIATRRASLRRSQVDAA